MIPERLAALRQEMEKRDIAVYIVPTADFHESEYVLSLIHISEPTRP